MSKKPNKEIIQEAPKPKRMPWDDGRCGGYVGPSPNSNEYNNPEYDAWIQSMERGS